MSQQKVILIVDDEEDILDLLKKKLTARDFQVYTASRGQEAIDMAKLYNPGLILMDIVLPDVGGPEVVKTIKEDPRTRHIPVIFLSGIVSKDDHEAETSVHVDGVRYNALGKPFMFDELYREVEKIFMN